MKGEPKQISHCEICKNDIEDNQNIVHCVFCENKFHEDHLKAWTKNSSKCPICRERFPFQMMAKLRRTKDGIHNPAIQNRIQQMQQENEENQGYNRSYIERVDQELCFVCGESSNTIFNYLSYNPEFRSCSISHFMHLNSWVSLTIGILILLFWLLPDHILIIDFFFAMLVAGFYFIFLNSLIKGQSYREKSEEVFREMRSLRVCRFCSVEDKNPFFSFFSSYSVCSLDHLIRLDLKGSVYLATLSLIPILVIFNGWLQTLLLIAIPGYILLKSVIYFFDI